MPWLAIGLKLLGIGKGIFSFFAGLFRGIGEFAGKHPVLFAAIVIDIILLAGCYWGYRQHETVLVQDTQITNLKKDNGLLSTRLNQYVKALADAQRALVNTIEDNNKAIDNLKKEADKQKARAEVEAAKTAKLRDQYVALQGKYRQANPSTGTAEERLAREWVTNREFIKDYQKVKR